MACIRFIKYQLLFLGFQALGMMVIQGCTPLMTPEITCHLREIRIDRIPERSGQHLRHDLMRQFQCSEGPGLYRLKVSLNEDSVNLDIGRDAKANFSTVTTGLKYELIRLKDQKVIGKGEITAPNYKVLTESYYSQTAVDTFTRNNNIKYLCNSLNREVASLLKQELSLIP
jgi:hypothetical protein